MAGHKKYEQYEQEWMERVIAGESLQDLAEEFRVEAYAIREVARSRAIHEGISLELLKQSDSKSNTNVGALRRAEAGRKANTSRSAYDIRNGNPPAGRSGLDVKREEAQRPLEDVFDINGYVKRREVMYGVVARGEI